MWRYFSGYDHDPLPTTAPMLVTYTRSIVLQNFTNERKRNPCGSRAGIRLLRTLFPAVLNVSYRILSIRKSQRNFLLLV